MTLFDAIRVVNSLILFGYHHCWNIFGKSERTNFIARRLISEHQRTSEYEDDHNYKYISTFSS